MAINTRNVLIRLRTLWGASSNKALAAKLGVGESTPSSWNRTGIVPFDICLKTVDKFGCSLDELIYGIKSQPVSESELLPIDRVAMVAATANACDLIHELQLIPEIDKKASRALALAIIKEYKEIK